MVEVVDGILVAWIDAVSATIMLLRQWRVLIRMGDICCFEMMSVSVVVVVETHS